MRINETVEEKIEWNISQPNAYSTIISPINPHKLWRKMIADTFALPCMLVACV
jgi:hypothetical protein